MAVIHKSWRISALGLLLVCVSGFTECYKPVTRNQLPRHIRTVAVPAFQNEALRYKIESRFSEAVINEIVRRGRGLRVQGDREGADAVVEGVIKSFSFGGVLLDQSGRARVFEVTIVAAVTVRDQVENRVLYDNQNFIFRGEFEFANDPRSFFNEEDPAVQRMARSFAESVVSILVNGFGVNEEK
ncbi:MAG TPA: LptE family protein [Pyrinomonadaceae bacterium]